MSPPQIVLMQPPAPLPAPPPTSSHRRHPIPGVPSPFRLTNNHNEQLPTIIILGSPSPPPPRMASPANPSSQMAIAAAPSAEHTFHLSPITQTDGSRNNNTSTYQHPVYTLVTTPLVHFEAPQYFEHEGTVYVTHPQHHQSLMYAASPAAAAAAAGAADAKPSVTSPWTFMTSATTAPASESGMISPPPPSDVVMLIPSQHPQMIFQQSQIPHQPLQLIHPPSIALDKKPSRTQTTTSSNPHQPSHTAPIPVMLKCEGGDGTAHGTRTTAPRNELDEYCQLQRAKMMTEYDTSPYTYESGNANGNAMMVMRESLCDVDGEMDTVPNSPCGEDCDTDVEDDDDDEDREQGDADRRRGVGRDSPAAHGDAVKGENGGRPMIRLAVAPTHNPNPLKRSSKREHQHGQMAAATEPQSMNIDTQSTPPRSQSKRKTKIFRFTPKNTNTATTDETPIDDEPQPSRQSTKSIRRRPNFNEDIVAILAQYYNDHLTGPHLPYPPQGDKELLAVQTGLNIKQVNDWFINARRRRQNGYFERTAVKVPKCVAKRQQQEMKSQARQMQH